VEIHKSVYKEKEIAITLVNNKPELKVNGKVLETDYDEDLGKYFSSILPYKRYDSLVNLAEDYINRRTK